MASLTPIKLALLGDNCTGKSSLMEALKKGINSWRETTVRSFGFMHVSGRLFNVGLWDPNEQADVYMLVFSVIEPKSFYNLISWTTKVIQSNPTAPIIVIGTKTDLRNDVVLENNQTPVTFEMGKDFVSTIGAVDYAECCTQQENEVLSSFDYAFSAVFKKIKSKVTFASLVLQACKINDLDTVVSLIDFVDPASIDCVDSKGKNSLDYAVQNENNAIVVLLTLAGYLFSSLFLFNIPNDLSNRGLKHLPRRCFEEFELFDELNLRGNYLSTPLPDNFIWNISKLILSQNSFTTFPIKLGAFPNLTYLDVSNNKIPDLCDEIFQHPKIAAQLVLNISFNSIEFLSPRVYIFKDVDATGNPLDNIMPEFRGNKDKIMYFLKYSQGQEMVQWEEIKLMLLGQEAVGKTSLLLALQNEKFEQSKNMSTNGVHIAKISLTPKLSFFDTLFNLKKDQTTVEYSTWDFGGQSVFHSTHRFFITSCALYLILYDMSNPETIGRVKYWIEQIGSQNDLTGTKPIIIVGTHADRLSSESQKIIEKQIRDLYPISKGRSQIQAHFSIGLSQGERGGLTQLKAKLLDIALHHPKIGIKSVLVPRSFMYIRKNLDTLRQSQPYLSLVEYLSLAANLGIDEDTAKQIATMLHDIGLLVWHNVPRLRDVVVIDPQWLADAMAGVVSFICQSSVAESAGMITWTKLQESFKLKFSDYGVYPTLLNMLEFFEVIYEMKAIRGVVEQTEPMGAVQMSEQMFFVPSLLPTFSSQSNHVSLSYWSQIKPKKSYIRHYKWNFYPAGFIACLLLRLVHIRLRLLKCWLDAAIVVGRNGTECAFIHFPSQEEFCLEIYVKVEEGEHDQGSLISELSYMVSKLHKDMYSKVQTGEVAVQHFVVISTTLQRISFEKCVSVQLQGQEYIEVEGTKYKLSDLIPDITSFKQVQNSALEIEREIGRGGFGIVYKGILYTEGTTIDVAVKETILQEDIEAFYDFQHEIIIMGKLKHVNLVQLYGITVSPLQMVLEFVPHSDLHLLLQEKEQVTTKWKLKLTIDCACAIRHLHSQTPPICHSDLRAPNIFIASKDENAKVVAKVADFGLSQQIFPFANRTLYNILETAPETWEGSNYDERSDVFSFGILLWRMFGSLFQFSDLEDMDQEFYYLQKNGKFIPPPKQREVILKGGRPDIHYECPLQVKNLIEHCWQTLPEKRPSFSTIFSLLLEFYFSLYGGDNYYKFKRSEFQGRIPQDHYDSSQLEDTNFSSYIFKSVLWIPSTEVHGNVSSIMELSNEIWFGIAGEGIEIADKTTYQIIQFSPFPLSPFLSSHLARKLVMISIDKSCVWAAYGSSIYILSTKTKSFLTSPLDNINCILSMVLIPEYGMVWVSDSEGNITIWDAQTFQKCYKFKVHPQSCAQSMAFMQGFVFIAVGRNLLAIQPNSMRRIIIEPPMKDRIQEILIVPHASQVWTCSRDGTVAIWKVVLNAESTNTQIDKIILEKQWRLESAAKSACLLSDRCHIAVATFNGSAYIWNINTLERKDLAMPEEAKGHNVQCILDSETALWIGIESKKNLMFHPHLDLTTKTIV